MSWADSDLLYRFSRNRAALIGVVIVAAVIAMALSASLLFPKSPFAIVGPPGLSPFAQWTFPLGTDSLGRDIAAGIFYGARTSLLIGLAASGTAALIGLAIGATAGYFGGWIDDVLMRITEMFQTMPNIVMALVLVTILGPELLSVAVAVALVTWPAIARLARAEFMKFRNQDFVQACIAIGMGDARIMVTQILPNALPPVIVMGSIIVALSILVESALSFLGLGDPNVMSWGMMIGNGRSVLRTLWHVSAVPGVAILVTVLGISLVGEGLNDALNPKLRSR